MELSPTSMCSTRQWLDPFAKEKYSLLLKIRRLPRESASRRNGMLNPLRMNTTTEAGTLFDNHPRRENKAFQLDITIVNPCVSSNLENVARQTGKHFANAIEWTKNKYRGSFLAIYSLLPLVMSTCGEVGSDAYVPIKELAIR